MEFPIKSQNGYKIRLNYMLSTKDNPLKIDQDI